MLAKASSVNLFPNLPGPLCRTARNHRDPQNTLNNQNNTKNAIKNPNVVIRCFLNLDETPHVFTKKIKKQIQTVRMFLFLLSHMAADKCHLRIPTVSLLDLELRSNAHGYSSM